MATILDQGGGGIITVVMGRLARLMAMIFDYKMICWMAQLRYFTWKAWS